MKDLLKSFKERSWPGTLEGFAAGIFYLPLIAAYIPLGFMASLVNFTYGERGHDPAQKALLPVYFMAVFLLTYLWEVLNRGCVLRLMINRWSWPKALLMHLALINVILIPVFWQKLMSTGQMGIIPYLLRENLLQALFAVLFLRTGSVLAVAGLHGAYNCFRFVIMNDVTGPFETFYFYSAASDDFYRLMIALTFLSLAIQIGIQRKWGLREVVEYAQQNRKT